MDFALATVALGHRCVHDFEHHRRNVQSGAVTLDEGNDGLVRYVQGKIRVDGNLLTLGGDFDVLVHGWCLFGNKSGGFLPPA